MPQHSLPLAQIARLLDVPEADLRALLAERTDVQGDPTPRWPHRRGGRPPEPPTACCPPHCRARLFRAADTITVASACRPN